MLSLQRELRRDVVFTASYVGNQGHHLLALVSANVGDPALCLTLPGCGPFGEDGTYTNACNERIQGTRTGQGSAYGENTADKSAANSNYNALQTTLKYQHAGTSFLLSYTFAKSIDQGSNLGEQLDPIDPRHSRAISAYDLKHDLVATYVVMLPFERILRHSSRWTSDWNLSGTTRFASGLPVTLSDNSDNSLLGTLGNGANNFLIDTPQYLPGNLRINKDGRNGRTEFNTASFPEEVLGTQGNAKRRIFYGPGLDNYDMSLQKTIRMRESKSLNLRMEGFNVFNHTQFFGPAAVNGQEEDPAFGMIVSAASPRLVQLAAKFTF